MIQTAPGLREAVPGATGQLVRRDDGIELTCEHHCVEIVKLVPRKVAAHRPQRFPASAYPWNSSIAFLDVRRAQLRFPIRHARAAFRECSKANAHIEV